MKKFEITYISKTDGDCCSVWTYASSKQAAIEDTLAEYWDVKEIVSVCEIK